jgi:hypothetical protein
LFVCFSHFNQQRLHTLVQSLSYNQLEYLIMPESKEVLKNDRKMSKTTTENPKACLQGPPLAEYGTI